MFNNAFFSMIVLKQPWRFVVLEMRHMALDLPLSVYNVNIVESLISPGQGPSRRVRNKRKPPSCEEKKPQL